MTTGKDDKLAQLLIKGKALLKRFLESDPEDRRELQQPLLQLIDEVTRESQTYFDEGQLQEAHRLYMFMQELGKLLTLANIEAMGWAGIGKVLLQTGRTEEALDNLLMALSIVQGLGYKEETRSTLRTVGQVYQAKGDHKEALESFKECLKLEGELGNPEGEAATLCSMAECYRALGQFNEALNSLQLSLKITRELGNREGEAAIISLIREVNKAMAKR